LHVAGSAVLQQCTATPYEASHWTSLLTESRTMSDVHYFVATHLMRLNAAVDRNVVLTKLAETIGRFVSLVAASPHEEAVQAFLAENPVLLAPTAVSVKAKHKLGAEYVTDFVIELPNEQYILVEIEAPKRRLFTQSGDPTKELTHAQRQVEDWRHWVRDNVSYARESLPGITDPECWVVLGRCAHMTPRDRKALVHRNAELYRIRILTYDDLLNTAQAHLRNLRGIS
jgi:antiviral defense system Shedu protein SduA